MVQGQTAALTSLGKAEPEFFLPRHAERLSAFAGQAALAIHNARLFEAMAQHNAELSALVETIKVISSTSSLVEMLKFIGEQMVNLIGVDGCTISHWDQESDRVVIWVEWRREWGDRSNELGATYDLIDYPTTRSVLENQQSVAIRVSNRTADQKEEALMQRMEIGSLLMTPLVIGNKAIGLIELDISDDQREFTSAEIRMCRALADQAAIAIENTRLFEAEAHRRQEAETLREVAAVLNRNLDRKLVLRSILEQLAFVVRYDSASIMLLSEHVFEIVARRSNRGESPQIIKLRIKALPHVQEVVERRLPLIIPETSVDPRWQDEPGTEHIRCWLGVPLVTQDRGVGLLNLNSQETGFYTRHDVEIENTSRYENLQRSNTELALAYDSTLEGWARALELRDEETEGHTRRVTEMTERLARAMGIEEEELVHVRRGALLARYRQDGCTR